MPDSFEHQILVCQPAIQATEGAGFLVNRAIPAHGIEAVGPFIFLDHFGPITVAPGAAKGAPDHPHAGIETLSLLLEGRSLHQDSLGNCSLMHAGDVQWMRAGRGVVHDEGPDAVLLRDGGDVHGVQLWLNMPAAHKQDAPAYRQFLADELARIAAPGAEVRLIAGQSGTLRGPLETHGNPFLAQVTLAPGGEITLATPGRGELAIYGLVGTMQAGKSGIAAGELGLLTPGSRIALRSDTGGVALLLGGDPLDAPIVRYGPFVSNSAQDMHRVIEDYQAGRMGAIAGN